MRKKILVVIPARFKSSRFPGKPLALINGKPMIQRVYEQVMKSKYPAQILVATDDQRILTIVKKFGGQAIMTSPAHKSGTDRVAEVASKIDCDVVINVQGDEPVINPEYIDKAIEPVLNNQTEISTLAYPIINPEDVNNPNVVKVVFNKDNFALYFSRAPIPFHKNKNINHKFFAHIGLYCFKKQTLLKFTSLKPSPLEEIEKLEQLRALENNIKIKIVIVDKPTISVDVPSDIEKVENYLNTLPT